MRQDSPSLDVAAHDPSRTSIVVRRLLVLGVTLALVGCTMFYTREYEAQSDRQLSTRERDQVFQAFRDYLVSKGLQSVGPSDADRVTFRIDGSNAGFALRQDWEDLLELSQSDEQGFRLRLMRIVHHPDDFSDEYLKRFVEQTEGFLHDATKRPIQLSLVPPPKRLKPLETVRLAVYKSKRFTSYRDPDNQRDSERSIALVREVAVSHGMKEDRRSGVFSIGDGDLAIRVGVFDSPLVAIDVVRTSEQYAALQGMVASEIAKRLEAEFGKDRAGLR